MVGRLQRCQDSRLKREKASERKSITSSTRLGGKEQFFGICLRNIEYKQASRVSELPFGHTIAVHGTHRESASIRQSMNKTPSVLAK